MEDAGGRTLLSPKWLLLPLLAAAIIGLLLAWPNGGDESVQAAIGPEMDVTVKSGAVACPGGIDPSHVCVPGGGSFTLSVDAVAVPTNGVGAFSVYLDYGLDITYKKGATCQDDVTWAGLLPASICLRGQTAAGFVNFGVAEGIIPPFTGSTATGNLVDLSMNCSVESSETLVQNIPFGTAPAGPDGAVFVEPDGTTSVTPTIVDLTVNCLGPTPTPTHTLPPNSPTPTVSPTPTDTPTPTPLPSERPDVNVTKVDLADPVDSGANFTYRVTVTSSGLQTAEGVKVVDELPAEVTFVSASSAGANCSEDSGVVTCQVNGDMEPDDVVIIDIVVTANSPVSDIRISNNVSITSTNEPFANTGNNKDKEETVILAPRSDVTVEKSGEPPFVEGNEDVTYTIVAKNLGPNKAENVEVSDILPDVADATFVSASAECDAPAGGKVLCHLDTIQPNGQKIVEITLTALPVTRDTLLKNVAMISADNELFSQTGNNIALENTPVVAPPPDLVVTKNDSADPILRLDFFSYSIFIENQGDGDALGVVVTDTLPKATIVRAITYINPTTLEQVTGADCDELGDNKVECVIDEINAHENVKITFDVRAPTILDDTVLSNTVSVSVLNPDEDPAGNQDTETTQLKACFDTTPKPERDNYVALQDILAVINAYQQHVGDAGYNVLYDFDGDGQIGLINDILPVISHYQQNCNLLLL